jgi:hypothetical protein
MDVVLGEEGVLRHILLDTTRVHSLNWFPPWVRKKSKSLRGLPYG